MIRLSLSEMDGKQIVYDFVVTGERGISAKGRFAVACCRFPTDTAPYAILIPGFVESALSDRSIIPVG